MEKISNDLEGCFLPDSIIDGKRNETDVVRVYVKYREHNGEAVIKGSEWPTDGIEWDVCPTEWESLESDIQDWLASSCVL